jgi:hypothetical protein
MNGVPLLVIAKNLGHRDTRMVEMHYGHLAEDLRHRGHTCRCAALRPGAGRDGEAPGTPQAVEAKNRGPELGAPNIGRQARRLTYSQPCSRPLRDRAHERGVGNYVFAE